MLRDACRGTLKCGWIDSEDARQGQGVGNGGQLGRATRDRCECRDYGKEIQMSGVRGNRGAGLRAHIRSLLAGSGEKISGLKAGKLICEYVTHGMAREESGINVVIGVKGGLYVWGWSWGLG